MERSACNILKCECIHINVKKIEKILTYHRNVLRVGERFFLVCYVIIIFLTFFAYILNKFLSYDF